jgi:ABC-type transporter Mla subunit MlaD
MSTYYEDEPGVVRERTVVVEQRRRRSGWVAGFVLALVAVVVAVAIWLAVSDDDNDGSIDVPQVTVDING